MRHGPLYGLRRAGFFYRRNDRFSHCDQLWVSDGFEYFAYRNNNADAGVNALRWCLRVNYYILVQTWCVKMSMHETEKAGLLAHFSASNTLCQECRGIWKHKNRRAAKSSNRSSFYQIGPEVSGVTCTNRLSWQSLDIPDANNGDISVSSVMATK